MLTQPMCGWAVNQASEKSLSKAAFMDDTDFVPLKKRTSILSRYSATSFGSVGVWDEMSFSISTCSLSSVGSRFLKEK